MKGKEKRTSAVDHKGKPFKEEDRRAEEKTTVDLSLHSLGDSALPLQGLMQDASERKERGGTGWSFPSKRRIDLWISRSLKPLGECRSR